MERNLVLRLKRERILLHYQMLSHVQNKHVFSSSHHVQNSSVNYEEKNATQLAKLSDKWIIKLLNKEVPAIITQQITKTHSKSNLLQMG